MTLLSLPGDAEPQVLRVATDYGDLPRPERWSSLLDCRFAAVTDAWRGVDLVEGARWGMLEAGGSPVWAAPQGPVGSSPSRPVAA